MKKPMVDTMMRTKFDTLYTPKHALTPLLKHLPLPHRIIWECCDAGGSNITQVLEANGHQVIQSDITTGFDFLSDTHDLFYDYIITNPPYSLKDKFLARAFELAKPFAFLLPLTALEGKKRGKMFREYGISVIVLDSRLDFTGKGANWFATAWFCWGLFENNQLIFESISMP